MRTRSSLVWCVAVAAGLFIPQSRAQSIPELPRITLPDALPAIRAQVQDATTAAQANPNNADASGKLGMILDSYAQYIPAADCYRRAHLLDTTSFQWAYDLGWVQAALGHYNEAEQTLREALLLKPDYLPAQLRLAESLFEEGKQEESARVYEGVVKSHSDCAVAYYGLGRIYLARGNEAGAVESLAKACDLFPSYGAAHYASALAFRKLGQQEKSQQNFKLYEQYRTVSPVVEDPLRSAVDALNLGPLAHARRGFTLERAGKIQEAIAEHEKALELDPTQVSEHVTLISLYANLGQFDKAEQHFQAATNLDPNQAEAYYNFGVLLFRRDKFTDAQRMFQRVIEINPFIAEAHGYLGNLCERQGRMDDALRQYDLAIANQPNYRLAHYHAGTILARQGKYDEAIQHFLSTLSPEDENTPTYLYALAATYARIGKLDPALKYIRSAREKAAARGDTQLLTKIDQDILTLENAAVKEK